eukprot:c45148_g1_i1 orf=3-176(-)
MWQHTIDLTILYVKICLSCLEKQTQTILINRHVPLSYNYNCKSPQVTATQANGMLPTA